MTLRTPSHARPASGQPPGAVRLVRPAVRPAAPARAASREPRRPGCGSLMIGLLLASLAWGAVGAWAVFQHASAAQDVVSTSEPLSLSAQQMYRSLSDADVTATTAFLSGPYEPLAARQRYAADIAQAATDLSALKNAASASSGPQLLASLSAVSTGLPVYTGDVSQAQTEYALGYLLTGGSFMQVASEEMHLTLLPAARTIYAQENAGLTAASARRDRAALDRGGPGAGPGHRRRAVPGAALAVAAHPPGGQLRPGRRDRAAAGLRALADRRVRRGPVDLHRGTGHGSAPAETLAQAAIDTQQIRGDEILNLISRSGDTTFEQDYASRARPARPRPGTLLTGAVAASPGGAGAQYGLGRRQRRPALVCRERPGLPARLAGPLRRRDQPGDRDRGGQLGHRVRQGRDRPQPRDRRGPGDLPCQRDRGQQRVRRSGGRRSSWPRS